MSAGIIAGSYRPAATSVRNTSGATSGSEPCTSGADVTTFSPEAAAATQPAQHSSGGGGILSDIGGFFSGAAHTVEHEREGALHTVENVGSSALNTARSEGSSLLSSAGHFFTGAAHTVTSGLSSLVSGAGHLAHSAYLLPFKLLSGKHNIPAPGLPPYPHLNAAEKQKALRPGQTVSQPVPEDDGGLHHEPVTLIYTGSLNKLQNALESQGWGKPSLFPISNQKYNGKSQVLALQKNAQLGGLSRDHLRVFSLGNNKYGISATRDTQPFVRINDNGTVSAGHETDPNIDGERDLVMSDILKADPSAANSWRVVQGKPTHAHPGYDTDNQVYEFSL